MYQIEVCANSVESCLAAQAAGATRVELCAGIPEGGTTPSYAALSIARDKLTKTRLHAIIRPRGGDFLYNELEREQMLLDIQMAVGIGVDGVVFGCLNALGNIDEQFLRELIEAAGNLDVTFHRAFDVCRQPMMALEQIINVYESCGKKGTLRLLTSGQQINAYEGISLLGSLQNASRGRIGIMAGCGVNETNIAEIANKTGITQFHFSAREIRPSAMKYFNANVSMGGTVKISETETAVTTEQRVNRTVEALLRNTCRN